jgi:hypothetical protein
MTQTAQQPEVAIQSNELENGWGPWTCRFPFRRRWKT